MSDPRDAQTPLDRTTPREQLIAATAGAAGALLLLVLVAASLAGVFEVPLERLAHLINS